MSQAPQTPPPAGAGVRPLEETLFAWLKTFDEAAEVEVLEDVSEGAVLLHVLDAIFPQRGLAGVSDAADRLRHVARGVCDALSDLAERRGASLPHEEFENAINFDAAAEHKCTNNLRTLLLGLVAASCASRRSAVKVRELEDGELRYILKVLHEDLRLFTFVRESDFDVDDDELSAGDPVNTSVEEAIDAASAPADFEKIIRDKQREIDALRIEINKLECHNADLLRERNCAEEVMDVTVQCSPTPYSPSIDEKVSYEALKPHLAEQTERLAQLEKDNQELSQEVERLQDEVSHLQDGLQIANAAVHAKSRELQALDEARAVGEERQAEVARLRLAHDALKEALDTEIQGHAARQKEAGTLRKERDAEREGKLEAERIARESQMGVAAAKREASRALDSLTALRGELREMKRTNAALEDRVKELDTNYAQEQAVAVRARIRNKIDTDEIGRKVKTYVMMEGLQQQLLAHGGAVPAGRHNDPYSYSTDCLSSRADLMSTRADLMNTARGPSMPNTARLEQMIPTPRRPRASWDGHSPRR